MFRIGIFGIVDEELEFLGFWVGMVIGEGILGVVFVFLVLIFFLGYFVLFIGMYLRDVLLIFL